MTNRNRWLTSHTSPGHDPVLMAMKAAAAVMAMVLVVLIGQLIGHARAVAAHPCPPARIAMLAPTGWGCGDGLTLGVKSR